jgi:GNAT superfamily N-acetyltransferase
VGGVVRDRLTVLVAGEAGEDGAVAGFSAVGACRDNDATGSDQEIWAIYVAPAQWARGVGRALFRASRELALERGARRLSLWVFATNERAQRFYAAVGLQPEPGSQQTFTIGGATLEEIRYVERLAPPVPRARA